MYLILQGAGTCYNIFHFLEFGDVEVHFDKDDVPQLPCYDVSVHQPCFSLNSVVLNTQAEGLVWVW
jgi:hypothetical protein